MLRDGVVQGNDAGMVFSIGRFRPEKPIAGNGGIDSALVRRMQGLRIKFAHSAIKEPP